MKEITNQNIILVFSFPYTVKTHSICILLNEPSYLNVGNQDRQCTTLN